MEIQIFPDGARYEDLWENGKPNSPGRFLYANGDEYEV